MQQDLVLEKYCFMFTKCTDSNASNWSFLRYTHVCSPQHMDVTLV